MVLRIKNKVLIKGSTITLPHIHLIIIFPIFCLESELREGAEHGKEMQSRRPSDQQMGDYSQLSPRRGSSGQSTHKVSLLPLSVFKTRQPSDVSVFN